MRSIPTARSSGPGRRRTISTRSASRADELKLIKGSKNPDYLHVNNLKPVGPNHWFDEGDQRFAPDNLIFDSRNANFIAIIDRKTRKIVWTLGPHFPPMSDDG